MTDESRELRNTVLALSLRLDNLGKAQAQERQILILQLQNILLQHGINAPELGQIIRSPGEK